MFGDTGTQLPHQRPGTKHKTALLAALLTCAIYSLPFLLAILGRSPFPFVAVEDEKIYEIRVMDAYRGGKLANPYLAEHQDAPRYMPEAAERFLAGVARITGLGPLYVIAISRIAFPVVIAWLVVVLAYELQVQGLFAMLAALLVVLAPTVSSTWGGNWGFPRYFRSISPAFYVLLLLGYLYLLAQLWRRPTWWRSLATGVAMGCLFYTASPYFWMFSVCAALSLLPAVASRVRISLLLATAVGCILGLPHLLHGMLDRKSPAVRETLIRLDLLTPGRTPDIYVPHVLLFGLFVLTVAVALRTRFAESWKFLFPLMTAGTFLLVQNVVTNRHLQGYHWLQCLLPLWFITLAAIAQGFSKSIRSAFLVALFVAVLGGAAFTQRMAFRAWQELRSQNPEFWSLDAAMPDTLSWLNTQTPPGSVVIAPRDIMDSLPLFTHNKVYYADYAGQHVLSDDEYKRRDESAAAWDVHHPTPLPFRADFALWTGRACEELSFEAAYRNPREHSCVIPVAKLGPSSRSLPDPQK